MPLHIACANVAITPPIVRLVLTAYPKAALLPDRRGYLPIHYAADVCVFSTTVALLLQQAPESAVEATEVSVAIKWLLTAVSVLLFWFVLVRQSVQ